MSYQPVLPRMTNVQYAIACSESGEKMRSNIEESHQMVLPGGSSRRLLIPRSLQESPDFANHIAVFNNEECRRQGNEQLRFYDIRHPVGFALLTGNDRLVYDQPKDFLPVDKDVKLMSTVLGDHGWYFTSPNMSHSSLSSREWDDCLERVYTTHLDSFSSFLFYYTGHGNSKGVVLSDGSCKPYKDIVTEISSINSLNRKPKIFIFDCCRLHKEQSSWNFFKGLTKFHNEHIAINYPPSDTVICYSASEGAQCFSHDDNGSFYTQELTRKLSVFMDRLSFHEIVTLAHGWVNQLAQQYNKTQQAVIYCALNSLLVFSVCDETCEEMQVFHDPSPPALQANVGIDKHSRFVYIKPKGPDTPASSALLDKDVARDVVGKGKIQYKTREDVVTNLPRLGQGVRVFVCYAPDPESPYHDPKERQGVISSNQVYVTHLIHDLEQLGFTVISDLHLGETIPVNWLQWYVSRMELCDYLIMVCSPAFKELFSCEQPKYHIFDERASWFLTYRTVMYADIHKEVTESSQTSKFLPVILDERFLPEDSIPTLFRLAPLYLLGSDGHREFNYDNMMGDYERLVCRMAGIDRMKMEKPVDQGVVQVAPPFSQRQAGVYTGPPMNKKGYKPKPWQPSTATSTTSEQRTPPPANISTQAQPNPFSRPTTQEAQAINQQPQDLTPHPLESNISSQVQPPPPPSSLPDKPPSHQIILWLSRNITNWRMVARLLHMNESEIERISNDNRGEEGEQRAQMFVSWQRHRTREYSYRTLGDVLLNTESNRDLYRDFYQKVEAEQST